MRNFVLQMLVGFAVCIPGCGQSDSNTRPKLLLGLSEEFVQSVPGEATKQWVFRCDRLWEKDDSLFVFEYDPFMNRTRRTTFVGNEQIAVDLFYWQTSYEHGTPESRAFKVEATRERSASDIPARYKRL